MTAAVVSSWNDFDTLRHAMVGRADFTCILPTEPATEAKIPADSDMRGMWGPRPQETVEKANLQLDQLLKVLEEHGVMVDRPSPIQWNQAVQTADFSTTSMLGCMPPRDVLLTLDHKTVIVEGSEVFQQEQLDKLGFEVIPIPFRDAYPFIWRWTALRDRRCPP